jgi:hypothetical protein
MKLFEHPDFDQAIIRAADHFRSRGLRESIIEKDYYVTEAQRIIEQTASDKIIFKGGTSLSKGWNLIQRSFRRHYYFSRSHELRLCPRQKRYRPGAEKTARRGWEVLLTCCGSRVGNMLL